MTVPRRRGTGPKARLKEFLAAFDAWHQINDTLSGSSSVYRTLDERKQYAALLDAMIAARKQITGTLGL